VELRFDPERHVYSVGNEVLPSITQILRHEGFIDTARYSEQGRERGTIVHLITHQYDTGELLESEIDPAYLPYLAAYKHWKEDSGFIVRDTEVPRYHKTLRYAGTPDKVGVLSNSIAIVEVKSGAVEPWITLQTAAQAELVKQDYGITFVRRYGLQLKPNGSYRMEEHTDRQDQGVWLSALACYQWKKIHLGRRA